jgi:hypothetical protein
MDFDERIEREWETSTALTVERDLARLTLYVTMVGSELTGISDPYADCSSNIVRLQLQQFRCVWEIFPFVDHCMCCVQVLVSLVVPPKLPTHF